MLGMFEKGPQLCQSPVTLPLTSAIAMLTFRPQSVLRDLFAICESFQLKFLRLFLQLFVTAVGWIAT